MCLWDGGATKANHCFFVDSVLTRQDRNDLPTQESSPAILSKYPAILSLDALRANECLLSCLFLFSE